jgi:cytochrome b involved in lipid metabolism
LPSISWETIRQHASAESLWVVLDGYVYDLTPFVHAHPGGLPILLRYAGKDASDAYRKAGHSTVTDVFRENYRIGKLESTAEERTVTA